MNMSTSNEQLIQIIHPSSQSATTTSAPTASTSATATATANTTSTASTSATPSLPNTLKMNPEEIATVIQNALTVQCNRNDLICVGTITGFCKENETLIDSHKKRFQLEIKVDIKGEINTNERQTYMDVKQLTRLLNQIKDQCKS